MFGVVRSSFTQCPSKGQAHSSDITFQCDSHDLCCACFEVLRFGGVIPPPPWGGTVLTLGPYVGGGGGGDRLDIGAPVGGEPS